MGAVIHHDMTLVDSSDDDAPFVLPGRRRRTQRSDSDTESDDEGNVARRVEYQGTVVESDDEQRPGRDFSLPIPSTVPVSEGSLRRMWGGVEVFPLTNGSANSPLHESLHSERVPRTESEDTETVDSRGESESYVDASRVVILDAVEDVEVDIPGPRGVIFREALSSLDGVDPRVNFEKRASVMKSIHKFLRGPFKNTLKLALEGATAGD